MLKTTERRSVCGAKNWPMIKIGHILSMPSAGHMKTKFRKEGGAEVTVTRWQTSKEIYIMIINDWPHLRISWSIWIKLWNCWYWPFLWQWIMNAIKVHDIDMGLWAQCNYFFFVVIIRYSYIITNRELIYHKQLSTQNSNQIQPWTFIGIWSDCQK